MSGAKQMLERHIENDTAVYWGAPVPDGNGTYTYTDPVEIKCVWLHKNQLVATQVKNEKKEVMSQSVVYTITVVEENGFLFHGSLDDVMESDSTLLTPKDVEGAFPILMVEKNPSIYRPGDYVTTIYL